MQISPNVVTAPSATVPRFIGGIAFAGTGRYSSFEAKATSTVLGDAKGYESLQQAIDALTFVTVGAHVGAAGVFDRGGRFYGRELANSLTFANGTQWSGKWRLEQYPADGLLIGTKVPGETTRAQALVAIVDGAQRIDVTHLPVVAKK
ncbi:MAG: hypothetical protein JWO69_1735 [Thermoleophilia bacterium]|nr:hypothetical protein [Thermoleophilia bacterium]